MFFNHLANNTMVRRIVIGLLLILLLAGCGAETTEPTSEPEEVAVATEVATDTPEPTETAVPTDTPEPTAAPTDTPEPTETPAPTHTPAPTNTPARPTLTPTSARPTLTPTVDRTETTEDAVEESPSESAEDIVETPVDAFDVLEKMNAAVEKADTVSLKQTVQVTAGGTFTQTMTQNCLVDQSDPVSSYCETIAVAAFMDEEPVEEKNEVVVIGDQMWMRSGDDDEWEEMPPDFMEQAGFSEDFGQMNLSEFITDASITGEMVISDADVYEITFELDLAAYMGSLLGEEMGDMFAELSEEMNGSGKLWVGQVDYYPRKADIELIFLIEGDEMITTTQAGYVYNEPVRIPDPTQ